MCWGCLGHSAGKTPSQELSDPRGGITPSWLHRDPPVSRTLGWTRPLAASATRRQPGSTTTLPAGRFWGNLMQKAPYWLLRTPWPKPRGWSCPSTPPCPRHVPAMSPPSTPAAGAAAPTAGCRDRVSSCSLLPVVQHPAAPPVNTQLPAGPPPRHVPCAGDKPGPRRGARAWGGGSRQHRAVKNSVGPQNDQRVGAGRKDGWGPPAEDPHGSFTPGPSICGVTRGRDLGEAPFPQLSKRGSLMRLSAVKPRQRDVSPPRALKAD